MVSTMEIPTRYMQRVAGYEARSGVQSQGTPREGSVFYAPPTAYVGRANAENKIGAKAAQKTASGIEDRVEFELKIFERALNTLTGGRPAQERINELKEQEEACIAARQVYRLLGTI